jgi:hypothetical protein
LFEKDRAESKVFNTNIFNTSTTRDILISTGHLLMKYYAISCHPFCLMQMMFSYVLPGRSVLHESLATIRRLWEDGCQMYIYFYFYYVIPLIQILTKCYENLKLSHTNFPPVVLLPGDAPPRTHKVWHNREHFRLYFPVDHVTNKQSQSRIESARLRLYKAKPKGTRNVLKYI